MTSKNAVIIKVVRWFLNTLFHQIVAVIAVYITWIGCEFFKTSSTEYALHVILSTLGYIPLMAESILLFANDNVWTQDLDRKKKYWLHGILITIGTALLTAGIGLEIKLKDDRNRKHFTSTHGLTGIISMVILLLSLFLGLLAANAQSLKRYVRPVWIKFLHNFLGIAGYVIGIASLWYGYDYLRAKEVITPLKVVTVVVTVWSLYKAIESGYNQIKTMFS